MGFAQIETANSFQWNAHHVYFAISQYDKCVLKIHMLDNGQLALIPMNYSIGIVSHIHNSKEMFINDIIDTFWIFRMLPEDIETFFYNIDKIINKLKK